MYVCIYVSIFMSPSFAISLSQGALVLSQVCIVLNSAPYIERLPVGKFSDIKSVVAEIPAYRVFVSKAHGGLSARDKTK